ncbi:LAQU0S50e00100g1_1 [Lachancea quebecensis]|uniref:LAQU0S50e00100g1_1 n=1 Tax=Lachancea quebecensis TaxID=1654605 RepID=A0A0P1L0B0_9SACH|nr:LAQU0S50e00100g1_1 [Lachancea quebecensis]
MIVLARNKLSIRRSKRLFLLSFVALLVLYVGHLSRGRLSRQSSEMIIQTLHKRLKDKDLATIQDYSACTDYFRQLSLHDKQWSIRGFGDEKTSFTSRKHIIDSVRHLRIFSQCFIHKSAPYGDLDIEKIEKKLFPLFTGDLPVFQRWDGLVVEGFPGQNEVLGSEGTASKIHRASQWSFWRHLKESMYGRGIVISLGENGVSDVKRLLKVLKATGNKLPIQLVHKGDLTKAAMQDIIKVGRGDFNLEIERQFQSIGNPQDIWFVNAERTLTSSSSHLFQRFSNKWIASLFNSFEEMILMDCDAVPFLEPELFLNATEYKETGAFFFKDRLIDECLKKKDLKFYQKLFPLENEYSLFGLLHPLDAVNQRMFFEFGHKHIMESGVVVLKRGDHLPGLLISTCLQLWKETSEPFYGDKEFFWLGQSISGNDGYRFNAHPAGALGVLNQDADENLEYICSTQPAHFSRNLQLLWLNGGARKCKIPSWNMDFSKHKFLRQKYDSAEKLKDFYESPINVNGAIIPPRSELSILQKINGVRSGFQKCTRLGCAGYTWCAYNQRLDGKGKTIHFHQSEVDNIKFIISVWNAD